MSAGHNQRLGAAGEEAAWKWYRERGFVLLDRNWRHGRTGELDLVCARKDLLVFVEVKTRSSDRFGSGLEALTPKKQQTIRALARVWLATECSRFYPTYRFDAVAVNGKFEVIVIEDAF